jgi:hypothetical protein
VTPSIDVFALNQTLEMTVVTLVKNLIADLMQNVSWFMEQLNASVTKDLLAVMVEVVLISMSAKIVPVGLEPFVLIMREASRASVVTVCQAIPIRKAVSKFVNSFSAMIKIRVHLAKNVCQTRADRMFVFALKVILEIKQQSNVAILTNVLRTLNQPVA